MQYFGVTLCPISVTGGVHDLCTTHGMDLGLQLSTYQRR